MSVLMRTTPQERQALGVTALLLIAGAGVRIYSMPAAGVEWQPGASDTLVVNGLASVRAEAEAELERERIRGEPLAPGERLDPNRADPLQLDRIPRVGPALAERIVAWREHHGPFRSLAEIDSVPGIGPSLLETLGRHLALPTGGPAVRRQERGAEVQGTAQRQPLDLNRASEAELDELPGIGPALAGRIVASRAEQGRFRAVDELERVPGIGAALVERLRPLVTVSP